MVGAAHAAGGVGDVHHQPIGHGAALGLRFLHRKVHTKTGAAGAAAEARVDRVGQNVEMVFEGCQTQCLATGKDGMWGEAAVQATPFASHLEC